MGKSLSKSRFIELFGDPRLNNKKLPIKKIKDFAKCIAGATPSTAESSYWDNGTIPWMSSGEVNQGRIYSTEKKITQKGYDNASTKLIPPHTVVIAMAGQGKTRGTVGVAEIELCTNQSICSVVTDDTVDVDYLYYFLKLQYEALRGASNGAAGRGGLNLKIIGDFPVIVPDLNLQKSFVKCVNQIDKSKFILQKMIEKLELLKKSRFIELFGDPFLIDEKEKVPFKNAIAETVKGPFGSDMKKSLFVPKSDTTYKVFSQVNAIQKDATAGDYYISAEYYEKMKRFTVNSGDYIVTCDGTLGKIYCLPENIEKGVISSSLLRIALNKDVISNVYFETIWNMYMLPMLVRRSRNACLVHLPSAKDIGNLPVPIPNIDKQRDYDKFSNQIDKSKLILQKQLEDLVGETK